MEMNLEDSDVPPMPVRRPIPIRVLIGRRNSGKTTLSHHVTGVPSVKGEHGQSTIKGPPKFMDMLHQNGTTIRIVVELKSYQEREGDDELQDMNTWRQRWPELFIHLQAIYGDVLLLPLQPFGSRDFLEEVQRRGFPIVDIVVIDDSNLDPVPPGLPQPFYALRAARELYGDHIKPLLLIPGIAQILRQRWGLI
jgi:hypothetical protein